MGRSARSNTQTRKKKRTGASTPAPVAPPEVVAEQPEVVPPARSAASPGRTRKKKRSGALPASVAVPEIVTDQAEVRPAAGDEEEPARLEPGDVMPGRKIQLPPSGLASDILGREEAQDVDASLPISDSDISPAPGEPPAPQRHHHGDALFLFAPTAREDKKTVEATEQLVTFFLAEEEYGLDVRFVQEIIRVGEITIVPRAPLYVKGVLNLRGRIIPVVDLKRKLGLGDVDGSARSTRIVVVKVRDRLIGLLVDGVSQVLKVPVSTIEPAPDEVIPVNTNYIRGVAKMDARLIILMELAKVLAIDTEEGPHGG